MHSDLGTPKVPLLIRTILINILAILVSSWGVACKHSTPSQSPPRFAPHTELFLQLIMISDLDTPKVRLLIRTKIATTCNVEKFILMQLRLI